MQSLAQPGLGLASIVPVFISSSLSADGSWAGPYETLRAKGIAIAWAVPAADRAIRYLLHDTRRQWEAEGIDWQAQALNNLSELSNDPCGAASLLRDNGDTWLISFMYSDGFGSSRLLLADRLQRVFPKGYRVAMPERNRAFAFSVELDPEEADTIRHLIEQSYSKSEQRLSPEVFEPNALLSATPTSTT